MILFKYEHSTPSDIINNIKLISEYSIIEYSILAFIIILFIVIVVYVFPFIVILSELYKESKENKRRKQLIKQILIQKDINHEIEKELNL
jgi:hypothetical protein